MGLCWRKVASLPAKGCSHPLNTWKPPSASPPGNSHTKQLPQKPGKGQVQKAPGYFCGSVKQQLKLGFRGPGQQLALLQPP